MKTIDITPTWAGMMPGLFAVIEHSETQEGKDLAKDEIMKLAHAVDMLKTETLERANDSMVLELKRRIEMYEGAVEGKDLIIADMQKAFRTLEAESISLNTNGDISLPSEMFDLIQQHQGDIHQ